MSIKIAIFELGSVPDEVKDKYPGYSKMIQNWLSPFMPEVVFTRVLVVDGEAIPDVENFDGFIYSGSKYGVYDDIVWIHPLEEFIRNTALLNKPQFGICFGHQIIAQALGGKAVKSDRGWGCGMYEYEMRLDGESKKTLSVLTLHQDQVIEIPVDAKIVGGTEFCPMGAVRYAQAALTVQFHPEFSNEYMHDLLDLRGGVVIPIEIADAAKNTLNKKQSSAVVAAWAADFFHHELAP